MKDDKIIPQATPNRVILTPVKKVVAGEEIGDEPNLGIVVSSQIEGIEKRLMMWYSEGDTLKGFISVHEDNLRAIWK